MRRNYVSEKATARIVIVAITEGGDFEATGPLLAKKRARS